jgi:hypothetical protein
VTAPGVVPLDGGLIFPPEPNYCQDAAPRPVTAPTLPSVPLDDDTTRELSRAAKQVKAFTERRNQLIRDAIAAGHGVREVARAVELNHATVLNIVKPKKRGQS